MRIAAATQGPRTMFDLTGKKALVTGASGGIGEAIARVLHRQGAAVAISGTRREALEALAGDLSERAHVLICNLAAKDEVETLVPRAEEAMGQIDILVNNAGVTRDNIFVRLSDEDWDRVIAVDLSAAFRLTRSAVRGMMRRRYGRIVGITSVVGVTGNAGQGNYAAAKAGMIGMTKALAHEVASRNVTVNCVAPGFVDTAMTRALTEKQREMILAAVPAARLGGADEVAAAVLFLASTEAACVTGHPLHVNGGMARIGRPNIGDSDAQTQARARWPMWEKYDNRSPAWLGRPDRRRGSMRSARRGVRPQRQPRRSRAATARDHVRTRPIPKR